MFIFQSLILLVIYYRINELIMENSLDITPIKQLNTEQNNTGKDTRY